MGKITLLDMTLKNFKGLNFQISPRGHNMSIYGENGQGKTRIYDAFLWLLTGKDSFSRADFEIKNLDSNGDAIHKLNHEVGLILQNGVDQVTIRKVYSEIWGVQKDSGAEKVFTGKHENKYFIDAEAATQGKFKELITAIAGDEEALRILTNPRHFPEVLPWQKRREILLSMCGNLAEIPEVASNQEFAGLLSSLKTKKLTDYRKGLVSKKGEIKKEIDILNVKIEEANKSLASGDLDVYGAENKLLALRVDRKKLEGDRNLLLQSSDQTKRNVELQDLRAKLVKLDNDKVEEWRKINSPLQDKMEAYKKQQRELESTAQDSISQIAFMEKQIVQFDQYMADLRSQWKEKNAEELSLEPTVCPKCCHSWQDPEAIEKFNLAKSKALESINAQGLDYKKKKEVNLAAIENHRKIMATANESIKSVMASITAVEKELQQNTEDCHKKSPEMEALEAKIAKLLSPESNISESSDEKVKQIDEAMSQIDQLIIESEQVVAQAKTQKATTDRIKEMETQIKKLSQDYAGILKALDVCDQLTRLMESHINAKFQGVQFKMFNILGNGEIEDCCEVMIDGVPYEANLSRGYKVLAGMSIIHTLQDHYDFYPPVFIDDREGLTLGLPDMKCQVISLYASKDDKTLRTEEN